MLKYNLPFWPSSGVSRHVSLERCSIHLRRGAVFPRFGIIANCSQQLRERIIEKKEEQKKQRLEFSIFGGKLEKRKNIEN